MFPTYEAPEQITRKRSLANTRLEQTRERQAGIPEGASVENMEETNNKLRYELYNLIDALEAQMIKI